MQFVFSIDICIELCVIKCIKTLTFYANRKYDSKLQFC